MAGDSGPACPLPLTGRIEAEAGATPGAKAFAKPFLPPLEPDESAVGLRSSTRWATAETLRLCERH